MDDKVIVEQFNPNLNETKKNFLNPQKILTHKAYNWNIMFPCHSNLENMSLILLNHL